MLFAQTVATHLSRAELSEHPDFIDEIFFSRADWYDATI
jgi:hypothetical protein